MIRPEYLPDEISNDTLVFLRERGVIREDNTIDAIKAFHEMDAYRRLISNATRVYDQLGGYTQETTLAETVIAAAVLREEQQRDEAVDDHTHFLREELAAATEALISFETGAPNPEAAKLYAGWKRDADRLIKLRSSTHFKQLLAKIQDARRNSVGAASGMYGQLHALLKGTEHV